jgi:hypothetical protein
MSIRQSRAAAKSGRKPVPKFRLDTNLLRRAASYLEVTGQIPSMEKLLDADVEWEDEVFRMAEYIRALNGKE